MRDQEDWSLDSEEEVEKLIRMEKNRGKLTFVLILFLGVIILIPLMLILNLKAVLLFIIHIVFDIIQTIIDALKSQ